MSHLDRALIRKYMNPDDPYLVGGLIGLSEEVFVRELTPVLEEDEEDLVRAIKSHMPLEMVSERLHRSLDYVRFVAEVLGMDTPFFKEKRVVFTHKLELGGVLIELMNRGYLLYQISSLMGDDQWGRPLFTPYGIQEIVQVAEPVLGGLKPIGERRKLINSRNKYRGKNPLPPIVGSEPELEKSAREYAIQLRKLTRRVKRKKKKSHWDK